LTVAYVIPVAVFRSSQHVHRLEQRSEAVTAHHHETRDFLPNTTSTLDGLVERAYDVLRTIAHRHLAARGGGRATHGTLDTTALVHEAYLKLASASPGAWRDEAHFRAVASVAMRQILVDRARARATHRHGGGLTRVSFDETAIAVDDEPDILLAIDTALDHLAEVSPRLARLVELRFYGGLSEAEAATELGVTVRTVQRDWAKARMLLERALQS
jgi:RNA polymerase sigma factor (TIGR02999 family)